VKIPQPILPVGENNDEARILLMLNMVITKQLGDDKSIGIYTTTSRRSVGAVEKFLPCVYQVRRRRIRSGAIHV
jgi:hypothetical protein